MIIKTREIPGIKGKNFLEVKLSCNSTEVDLGWHNKDQARELAQKFEEALDDIQSFLEE